jgi:hypothetical protein
VKKCTIRKEAPHKEDCPPPKCPLKCTVKGETTCPPSTGMVLSNTIDERPIKNAKQH